MVSPGEISATIEEWLAGRGAGRGRVEAAFFGGSFTAIPRETQAELLGAVLPFIAAGRVDSIRISTRPDFLDPDTLVFLKDHGVGTVEVGVQSLSDRVLAASGRGHDAACALEAVGRLKEYGFVSGVQLMLGLPGESTCSTLAGARKIAALKPDMARIYPVLVLSGTGLARMWQAGRYHPLGLARAVILAGRVRVILENEGVRVVRCGLQAAPGLEEMVIAGPWHPAFGEMVQGASILLRARDLLGNRPGRRRMLISRRDRSALSGHGGHCQAMLVRCLSREGVDLVFSDQVARGRPELVD